MQNPSRILVYGASGAQGNPVAEALLGAGYAVRILTRSPERTTELASLGAEVFAGDYSDPESLARANAGMDGVFLLIPFFDPRADYARNAIAAAEAAGVRLIVWNTTGTIPPFATGNPAIDVRLTIRDALQASRVPHVAIAPTAYMENLLGPWTGPEVAARDTLAYPLPPGARMQWISHADVAAFVLEAFRRPHLAGRTFDVAGPESLGLPDMAARFSAALGRPIAPRVMQPEEFGQVLDSLFGPGAGAGAVGFYKAAFENPALITTAFDHAAVVATLPIRATSLETWVRERAALFAAPAEARA